MFFYRYERAVSCLETVKLKDKTEEQEMNELLSRAYTNLGVCFNKINMPRRACLVCHRVPIPTAKTHYKYVLLIADTTVSDYMYIENS